MKKQYVNQCPWLFDQATKPVASFFEKLWPVSSSLGLIFGHSMSVKQTGKLNSDWFGDPAVVSSNQKHSRVADLSIASSLLSPIQRQVEVQQRQGTRAKPCTGILSLLYPFLT